uniref:Variant surface glycoprotein 1125.5237 n=1 Tax=Trypanosoma brucei TaxID=5691 RepID=A0A1J0RCE5_9TRYP|nr:variant surface glycoprotein 1125.5237 [Trypanosoma brucei]
MKIQMLKKILVAISLALGAQCSKEKPTATMSKPSLSALTLSSLVDTLIGKTQGHTTTAKTIQHKLAVALAAGKVALPVAIVLEKQLVKTSAAKIEALERIEYAAANLANITRHRFGIKDSAGLKVPNFSKGNSTTTNGANAKANIYVEAVEQTCAASEHTTYNAAAAKAEDWETSEGFDELKIYNLQVITQQGSSACKPAIGNGSGSDVCANKAVSNGAATNTHFCVIGGELIKATPETYSKAIKNYRAEDAKKFNTGNFGHYVIQALAAANTALQTATTISSTFDPDDISNYASDDDFKAAIGLQYLGLDREKAIGIASDAVADVIKATYGTQSEMKNKFWEN